MFSGTDQPQYQQAMAAGVRVTTAPARKRPVANAAVTGYRAVALPAELIARNSGANGRRCARGPAA